MPYHVLEHYPPKEKMCRIVDLNQSKNISELKPPLRKKKCFHDFFSGVSFEFDYASVSTTAMALLQEDPQLEKMR